MQKRRCLQKCISAFFFSIAVHITNWFFHYCLVLTAQHQQNVWMINASDGYISKRTTVDQIAVHHRVTLTDVFAYTLLCGIVLTSQVQDQRNHFSHESVSRGKMRISTLNMVKNYGSLLPCNTHRVLHEAFVLMKFIKPL